MSTYVIGDIHGCYDKLQEMLRKINFTETDRLYLVGDYIDRGEKSLEMLCWLEGIGENIFPIKGNHDSDFAEYIRIMKRIDEEEQLGTNYDSNKDTIVLYETTIYAMKNGDSVEAVMFDHYGTICELLQHEEVNFDKLCKWAGMLDALPYFYRLELAGKQYVVVHAGFCEAGMDLEGLYYGREDFFLNAREDAVRLGGIKDGTVIAGHTPTIAKQAPFYTGGRVFKH